MIQVDEKECIGCGACEKDCFLQAIKVREKKAAVLRDCFHCGHCKGCGTCVDDCPGYVLELKHLEDRDRPEVAFGDECWHCANCRTSCPTGAIGFRFPLRMQV